jgi:outer membrane protein assembly factor BamB
MRRVFTEAHNLILAVKPGGRGDITKTHVLWTQTKMLPYVPSPLYYKGFIYMVKDTGLVNCLNAKTGKPAKQGRVQSGGYFSSPVCGDGKIYLVSQRGDVSVISAKPDWEVLSRSQLGEDVIATPAIAGGRIYLRTAKHLYCFGLPETR